MSWKKFYSLKKFIQEGRRLASGCQTVSFDLFDTLLVRRIHDPDIVKLPVARYISSRARQVGIESSWQTVQKLRDRVEQQQRAETAKTFDDHEACYPVFMEKTLREIFRQHYQDSLLEDVTRYELEMESSMLVPRAMLRDWLIELHGQGKQILILSDIYLPSEHLKILVERAGLMDFTEDVISSADSFLAKASGKAFPLVKERYGLDTSSWLHVGDNPISDGVRPSEFGLQAIVLHDGSEKYRKSIVRRYVEYAKGRPFYRGRALQQLMLPQEGENSPQSDLYIEGYNFLGPMIGAFVQYCADECLRLGVTKVFFLSREGYTFKKVWERCTPFLYPDRKLPETEYLYVSRMALAGASCAHEGLTRSDVNIAFLPHGNKDFTDLARIFKFDVKTMASHLARHNLAADSCLSPLHDGYEQEHSVRLMELLEDQEFQQEVKRQSMPANEALICYLEKCGFFENEQVAIIDIGWLGTIQRFLYNAVKHRADCPRFHGFLFGATRGIPYPDDLKNDIQGVLYDRNCFDLSASCIMYARDVFEESCRAPYPTLDGYERTDEGYRLKFRITEDALGQAEKKQDDYFAPLQQGIMDSAERFGAASALLGYDLTDYRPWFNYVMAAKLAFPKTSEVVTIRHKHHLDDFHGSNTPIRLKKNDMKQLWNCTPLNLRINPLLRLRFFWRHIRNVIKN
jgi:predicted HAD superfamily hydrolase